MILRLGHRLGIYTESGYDDDGLVALIFIDWTGQEHSSQYQCYFNLPLHERVKYRCKSRYMLFSPSHPILTEKFIA